MSTVASRPVDAGGRGPGPIGTDELAALAREIAADPERWRHAVRHDPGERTYVLLHEDDDVTVWLICWSAGHDTGFHDHDASGAGVAVAEGSVVDERLTAVGEPLRRRLTPESGATIEPTEIHRIHHPGGPPAVSVHAYSPPLRRTGAYEVAPDGRLLRHARPGDDALAPIASS